LSEEVETHATETGKKKGSIVRRGTWGGCSASNKTTGEENERNTTNLNNTKSRKNGTSSWKWTCYKNLPKREKEIPGRGGTGMYAVGGIISIDCPKRKEAILRGKKVGNQRLKLRESLGRCSHKTTSKSRDRLWGGSKAIGLVPCAERVGRFVQIPQPRRRKICWSICWTGEMERPSLWGLKQLIGCGDQQKGMKRALDRKSTRRIRPTRRGKGEDSPRGVIGGKL